MGVRLYNTATGRFLTADPVAGGNANAYIYPQDPINNADPTGKTYNANGHACTWTHCDFRMSNHQALLLADRMQHGAALAALGAIIAGVVGVGVFSLPIELILGLISGSLWFVAAHIQYLVDNYHNGIYWRVYYWGEVYVKQQ